jgi:tyrosyl-tRNA synthetase
MGEEEINALLAQHATKPHERALQKALAKDITCRVHNENDYNAAVEASAILFGNATSDALKKLSENDFLSVFEGVPQVKISKNDLSNGIGAIDFVSEKSGFLKSKGEAKRAFEENSISINKEKAESTLNVDTSHLINGKYILLQRGKKNYYLVIAE